MKTKNILRIEYFDTDESSYKHSLEIPLAEDPNLTIHDGVLHVANINGTTHYVPLVNVKQYFRVASH